MNERNPTVTEADLHAFADGLLPPGENARLEAWLSDNPEEAAKVAGWKAQNAEIKMLFAPYARTKDSDRLLVTSQRREDRSRLSRRLSVAAATVVVFLAGAAAGHYGPQLLGRPEIQLASIEALPRQAQSAFLVYASEVRHPVEVGADQEPHLATWLGKRLNIADLKVPSLKTLGFQLVGGRLLPVNGTPGALFMYEDASGKRITVLVGRNKLNTTTSFRFANAGTLDTFYWIDGDIGYAVTGEISRDMLRQVAEECYKQFPSS
ncbi:anti-sigma factor [Rhizobium sp. BK376]|uniref:anti-sigma factor family protein n=1 Tax=Rhizobium sp. BK376 TaxID=2512149 RepID=UPI00104DCDA9|nr:anti-sigma factor [Rhizobium sp. BK376]TCR83563.1 anti-sigma factor RsiW [Rhizobium sp. BK376]